MALIDDISEMTINLEQDKPPTRQEVYTILLRALIQIRQLNHRIRVLEGKQHV
jgi:hypothetical protein